ncbi:MAG: uroporphyrinogen-III synthase [Gammaproteobacteria bacterium]|jgi:uroporphyrinogen III methyltransferase/synthase
MTESAHMRAASPDARIVLTRSAEDCESWAASLHERGYETVSLPCIETRSYRSPSLRVALTDAIAEADWLVLTSQRGVSALTALLDRPLPEQLRVAVVGAATARAAVALVGRADFVASEATAAGLANELAETLKPRHLKLVLALAENAGDVLAQTLAEAGQHCRRFDVYRTIPAATPDKRRTLEEIGGYTVFLASPSAVLGFVNQVAIDETARLVSIGPSTTAAIERAGLSVHAQAATPSLAGMLEAIED